MLPSEAPRSIKQARSATIPGKVFLLGEYAVLGGLPALVATVGPRFRMSAVESDEEKQSFHPRSPIARLTDWAKKTESLELGFRFEDPWREAGGFGASTAQFALAYRFYAETLGWDDSWEKAWKLYRELCSGGPTLGPSGADLATQWSGGVQLFEPACEERSAPRCRRADLVGSSLLIFSAAAQPGRKVPTHEHLADLSDSATFASLLKKLEPRVKSGIAAATSGDVAKFGAELSAYADTLASCGLEIRATREDREAISDLPGVLGAKGTGALQADALVVLMSPGHGPEGVIELAQKRGLVLAANGLRWEEGVAWEK